MHDLRDYSTDKHRSVDDYAFGGGAGMVMSIEPIARCIEKLTSERAYDEVIFLTPDGELLNQDMANELSLKGNIMMLCGHYKGVDERVRELFISKEISIGDYVLSGGELGAAVLVIRPTLSKMSSAANKWIEAYAQSDGWYRVDRLQRAGEVQLGPEVIGRLKS